MSVFQHYDAEWCRVHVVPHLLGGVTRWCFWSLFLWLIGVHAWGWLAILPVTYDQANWERFQREYDPTYPVWSMVGDTVLTSLAAAVTAVVVVAFRSHLR